MRRRAVEAVCSLGLLGTVLACAPHAPSLAGASDEAVTIAQELEAALAAADGWRAAAMCHQPTSCRPGGSCERVPGMAPRRVARRGGIEVVGWRPRPGGLVSGLGTLCGSYRAVERARVRLAEVRGGGGALRVKLHVRALGQALDGRVREDDGYLWLDLHRLPGGRWRIVGLVPEDLITTLRDEPAFREHTRTAGLGLPGRRWLGPVYPPTVSPGAGLAAADLDGDGRVDLVVPDHRGCTVLRNRGDGRFRPAARVPCARDARGIAVADLDGDGYPELLVTSASGPLELWRGGGSLTFARQPLPRVMGAQTIVVVDLNADGRPDVVVTRAGGPVVLLLGGPGGGLEEQTVASGLDAPAVSLGACAGDIDGDGRPDLFITGLWEPGRLYRNEGGGRFRDVTRAAGVVAPQLGEGCALADVDGDGHVDLAVAAAHHDHRWLLRRGALHLSLRARLRETAVRRAGEAALVGTRLWRGDGTGHFAPVVQPRVAGAGWATAVLPFEREGGQLDLLVSCGLRSSAGRDQTGRLLAHLVERPAEPFDPGPDASVAAGAARLFMRVGGYLAPAGDRSLAGGPPDTRAAVAADVDGDGLLDLLLRGAQGTLRLLRNEATPRRFVRVRLLSKTGAPAFGATVEARAPDRAIVRQLLPSTHLGSGPAEVHFGVGRRVRLARLLVRWPDGTSQEVRDVPTNQLLTVRQGSDQIAIQRIPSWRHHVAAEPPGSGRAPAGPGAVTPGFVPDQAASQPVSVAASASRHPASTPAVRSASSRKTPPPPLGSLLLQQPRVTDGTGRPAQLRRGEAATVVHLDTAEGCSRRASALARLARRVGTRVVVQIVVVGESRTGCARSALEVLRTRGGGWVPPLPATALYDREGHLAGLQLGMFDQMALERALKELLRD